MAVSVVSVCSLVVASRTVGLGVSTHPGWLLVLVGGSLLLGTVNVTVTSLFNMMNARITCVLCTVGSPWLGLAISGALVQALLVVALLGLLLLGGMAVGARQGALGLQRAATSALAG